MNNGDTSRSGEICAFVEIQRYETFEMPANNPDPITNGFGGRSGCPDVTSTRALSVLLAYGERVREPWRQPCECYVTIAVGLVREIVNLQSDHWLVVSRQPNACGLPAPVVMRCNLPALS